MTENSLRNKTEEIPFPIKAEYYSGIVKVKFANNINRYIKVDVDTTKKASLNPLKNMPKELTIREDGTVVVNEDLSFTARELWDNGTLSVNVRPFI